ncbi:EF hand associated-domain-containing protein [Geopyxis carbonaria]|nr:EF hand associated-domain-containing protein [Geopyxis carbonaria]
MSDAVRVVVCGDEGVGKTSLITCFVKDNFRMQKLQPTLPPLAVAGMEIVDTSALPQERKALSKEVRRGNVICLVYSDHYSYERVSLFWLPLFRSLGVNLPVVLCANKSDLYPDVEAEKEMLPIMLEFKEIDTCIRASAKELRNINELFYLCQRAVTHPVAPLFDAKEQNLKPAAVAALRRIFFLCDRDQDGVMNDFEMQEFQKKCFNKPLAPDDLNEIKRTITKAAPDCPTDKGISCKGFLQLNKIFAEKGRHETIWCILRTFHYTDSLSLKDSFLHPRLEVPEGASAELSPIGYRFFVDLFLLFDKDNDGGLNGDELAALFAPTPGLPQSWAELSFPSSTVRSEAGHITLQGWLAQWSMTTFQDPKTTLEYLAYLGFEEKGGTTSALKVTKPRRRKRRQAKVERNVVLCYVLGSSGCGKSTILDAFLNKPFNTTYNPTIKPRTAVNSVEMQGGKQCYLIVLQILQIPTASLTSPTSGSVILRSYFSKQTLTQ